MPDIISTALSLHCQSLLPMYCVLTLLAKRPGHVIFGLAVTRLALAAGDEHFRRAFFGSVGVDTLAFLVALALAQLVGAGLAVRRTVGGDHTGRPALHHDRGLRHVGQVVAGILCSILGARVEVVDGLSGALDRRQQRFGFLEQFSDLVDQARIFRRREWRRRLDLLRRVLY